MSFSPRAVLQRIRNIEEAKDSRYIFSKETNYTLLEVQDLLTDDITTIKGLTLFIREDTRTIAQHDGCYVTQVSFNAPISDDVYMHVTFERLKSSSLQNFQTVVDRFELSTTEYGTKWVVKRI